MYWALKIGYLVGERINRAAQGYWFVPGGRMYKGEALTKAFGRITFRETRLDSDDQFGARFNEKL